MGLEVKNSGQGIISWNTRGQLWIESNIKAITEFKSTGYEDWELVSKKPNKEYLKKNNKQSEKNIFNLPKAG